MAEQNISTSVGKVILIEGNVYIKEVTGELIPLIEGMNVYAGQLIQTGPQGSILVELSNGEVLSLGRNTLVRLDEDLLGLTDVDENQTTEDEIRKAIEAVQEGNFDALEATAAGQQVDLSSAAQAADFIPPPRTEGEVTSGYDTGTFNTSRQTDNRGFDTVRFVEDIPQNDTPVAVNDTATLNEDASAIIDVLSNDSDLDGDSISVSSVTQPANGAVVINTDGTVTYTPNANYNGTDSFTYTLSDGQGGTSTATVSLTVDPQNDTPVAVAEIRNVLEDQVISGVISASDADLPSGEHLTFSTSSTVEGLTFNSDGSYTFDASGYDDLDQGEKQEIIVPVTVTDEQGAATETSLTININGQNNDLTYVSESASYQNVIGIYEVGNDGKPVSGSIVLINQNGMQAGTHLADLDPEQDYEFFIMSNGAGNVSETDSITFDNSGDFPVLLVDGQPSVDPVYYTQPELNTDGKDHFKFTLDGNGGTVISIEDLPNLGDADFGDVVLYTNFEMNNHIVVTSDVASESDSGISHTDDITQDNTPIIQGNTESGAMVIISDVNGLTLGQARADAYGDYAIEISALADGTHEITVTAIDGNGLSASTTQSITIDTQIESPVITNIIDHNGDYSNVTLYGTGEPGTTVTLFNKEGSTTNGNQTNSSGFVPVATALPVIVDENGHWTVDISTLNNTPINDNEFFYATQQDIAGNVSEASNTVHYWHGTWSNTESEAEDDFIMMGSGRDSAQLISNDDNDHVVIDGGDGTDTVTFKGDYSDFTVSTTAEGYTLVTESISSDSDANGVGDVNELRHIEFIKFDDGTYSVANQAFIPVDNEASMPEIELNIGEMVAVTQEGYQYDGDEARNANGHGHHTLSYDSYAEALDAQNGANHDNGSLVYKNVNNAVWNLNDSNDKLFVVTQNANDAVINLAQGNNTIIFEKEPGKNIVINVGTGKDTLVLSGQQNDYNLTALNDNNGILSGLITGPNNMSMTINNIDCIAFNDGSTIGDSSLYQGAGSTAYFYSLEVEAELEDTDGSETLSNIQLTGLPDDGSVSVMGTGVTANQDGSYTIELLEDGSISEDVKLASNRELAEDELSDIHASVTAIEANGGDTATAEVNDAGDHFLYGLDNEDDVFIIENEDDEQDSYIENFDIEHDVLDISDVISSEASEETLSNYLNLSLVDSDEDGQVDDTKISIDRDGNAETQEDISTIYIQDNQLTDNNLDDMNIDFQND